MPFQFRKESIEEDLNSNFPSQGQGNPPLYYSLSEVVVPTYSINQSAEGSGLPENLQTALDFATGHQRSANSTDVFIDTPGFWLIDTAITMFNVSGVDALGSISISDGLSTKKIYQLSAFGSSTIQGLAANQERFVVFVRSGDEVSQTATGTVQINTVYRQIAAVNGDLVNPLGYSAA